MECKKALIEAEGDVQGCEELLRIKLGTKASKPAGRTAAEGVVARSSPPTAKLGALVEVNCETDFVAQGRRLLWPSPRPLLKPGRPATRPTSKPWPPWPCR